jgi:hypothetical protein
LFVAMYFFACFTSFGTNVIWSQRYHG